MVMFDLLYKARLKGDKLENQKQSIMGNIRGPFLLFLIVLIGSVAQCQGSIFKNYDLNSVNRGTFPEGFIFGTASSSYQVCV